MIRAALRNALVAPPMLNSNTPSPTLSKIDENDLERSNFYLNLYLNSTSALSHNVESKVNEK